MTPLLRRLHASCGGTIVIEWLFVMPLFMIVFFVILQCALVMGAVLVTDYAAYGAARAAVVGLPDHTQENARNEAVMVLAAISPSNGSQDTSGRALAETIRPQGAPWKFGAIESRAAFARAAMSLDISPKEIAAGPAEVRVKLAFPFRLEMPFAAAIFGDERVVAGVRGRYLTIRTAATLQSHGSRVAADLWTLGRLTP